MKKFILFTSLIALLSIGFGYMIDEKNEVTATNASNKSKFPEYSKKIAEKMENSLEKRKNEGRKWINSKAPNEVITAHVTFNNQRSLNAVKKFAEENNMKLLGWSQKIDFDKAVMTGGYKIGENETIEEAQENYLNSLRAQFERGVERLTYLENFEDISQAAREAATFKKLKMKEYLTKLNKDSKFIYGLKIKAQSTKIKEKLATGEIVAVGISSADDKSMAPFREIPRPWVEGMNK